MMMNENPFFVEHITGDATVCWDCCSQYWP